MRAWVWAALLCGHAALAAADDTSSVNVSLTPQGQQLAQDFGDSADALIAKVKTAIDTYYQTARIGPLLDAFLTTTEFANKSLGVDYQTQPGELEVGVVADGALSTDPAFTATGHLTTGAVINLAVMGGANLGRWGAPRWSAFANAFYETNSLFGISLKGLAGHLLTAGAHVQYKVVLPSAPGAVRWTGVDATGGLELARWTLDNEAPIVTHFTLEGSTAGESRNLTLTSTGTLSLVATTFTMPVEVTTGVRLWNVLGLYAGGGVDLTVGSSTLTAALAGDLSVTQDGTPIGSVQITASGQDTPSVFDAHALAGVQLDAGHVHVVVEGLIAPQLYGASTALRASF